MQPTTAVLFDLDGTLVDTRPDIARALARAFAAHGLTPPPATFIQASVGRGAVALIDAALAHVGHPAGASERLALFNAYLLAYADIIDDGDSAAMPYPGAEAVLESLAERGCDIAIVTNKDQMLAARVVHQSGLAPYVDLLVGLGAGIRRKPEPDALLQACARLGIAPSQAWMVGDTTADVLAARAAGMPIVGVTYGYQHLGSTPAPLCDRYADRLSEVPALLALATGAMTSSRQPPRLSAFGVLGG